MPESDWLAICSVGDIPYDTGKYVEVGNRALAVFRGRDGDDVRVMDDACPHAGAPLSAGHVDDSGVISGGTPRGDGCVVCALHGWAFRLRDGRCPDNDAIGVRVYESRVVDGVVQVKL